MWLKDRVKVLEDKMTLLIDNFSAVVTENNNLKARLAEERAPKIKSVSQVDTSGEPWVKK